MNFYGPAWRGPSTVGIWVSRAGMARFACFQQLQFDLEIQRGIYKNFQQEEFLYALKQKDLKGFFHLFPPSPNGLIVFSVVLILELNDCSLSLGRKQEV